MPQVMDEAANIGFMNNMLSGSGDIATMMLNSDFNINLLRKYIGNDGFSYVDVPVVDARGHQVMNAETQLPEWEAMVTNAPATLFVDEWKYFEDIVLESALPRLQFIDRIRSRGLVKTFDAWGYVLMQYQTRGDITGAKIGMDPLVYSERDRPESDYANLPLPVIWKDFDFTAREIAASRKPGGSQLDRFMIERSAFKVAEEAEKLFLGLSSTFTYAGATLYGALNHPDRFTYTMDDPSQPGWIPEDTIVDLLAMLALFQNNNYRSGPYELFFSPNWQQYLGLDYSAAKGDNTLLERIRAIGAFSNIQMLDQLTGYTMLIVNMERRTVELINGMDITTLQWTTDGAMRLFWKIMAMLIPLWRPDSAGNLGVVHGSI